MSLNKSVGNRKIKQIEKAWMAGFLDGEGWIGMSKQIRKNRPSPTYRTAIKTSNTKNESLMFFKERYGGKITKGKGAYQWACPAVSKKKLLNDIRPFLVIKISQARLILDYIERFGLEEISTLQIKEEYYQNAKKLNENKYKEQNDVIK